MVKVKIFEAEDAEKLETAINAWLEDHPDSSVLQSNMVSSKRYGFYLLYTTPEILKADLNELAAKVDQGSVLPATEINPEILEPKSLVNQ